jgi:branched-chain amino acid transport system ATP-binding protein
MHTLTSAMAHGEHRQLELAMTLASRPRLLLLDEPMAGMSQAESVEMVKLLKTIKTDYGVILVEHDMDAVFALADRVSVLVYGRILATGTPDDIRRNPEVRAVYLGDEEAEAI